MSSEFKVWTFGGKTYRLIRRICKEREYGYVEYDENHYNILQMKCDGIIEKLKNKSAWKDVEEESIPGHVIISLGTLGYTDWKSNLHEKCRKELNMA